MDAILIVGLGVASIVFVMFLGGLGKNTTTKGFVDPFNNPRGTARGYFSSPNSNYALS